MNAELLLYAGSGIMLLWGVAHILPTKAVVAGFEPLTQDNRRVLTMEWVAEGVALVFIGGLALLMTALVGSKAAGAGAVYRACAAILVVLAVWTALTGGRTAVVQFKICSVVKTVVAALFVVGSMLWGTRFRARARRELSRPQFCVQYHSRDAGRRQRPCGR